MIIWILEYKYKNNRVISLWDNEESAYKQASINIQNEIAYYKIEEDISKIINNNVISEYYKKVISIWNDYIINNGIELAIWNVYSLKLNTDLDVEDIIIYSY